MKTLCKFCLAVVLTLTFATAAFAGDIHTTVTEPEPDPTQATAQGEMTTGVTGTMHTGNSEAADDSGAADVVGLVVDVLSSLF